MFKATALKRLDALRELVERLPKDAEVLGASINTTFIAGADAYVHVYDPDPVMGDSYAVVDENRIDILGVEYEWRAYLTEAANGVACAYFTFARVEAGGSEVEK